jgi:hypothetical protein
MKDVGMIVTEKRLQALRDSIYHWERISEGLDVTKGSINCPCCILAEKEAPIPINYCSDCPIGFLSGRGCGNLGYDEFMMHVMKNHLEPLGLNRNPRSGFYHIYCEECRALATIVVQNIKKVLERAEAPARPW